jgi:hypothetical protein
MRYQFNFEAEPFAAYPELDLLRTNLAFNREVFFPHSNGELEEEFRFQGTCRIRLQCHRPRLLAEFMSQQLRPAISRPGIYVIRVNREGKQIAWYVGISESVKGGIRGRFMDRFKSLRDFDIPDAYLRSRNIMVSWAILNGFKCGGFQWERRNKTTGKASRKMGPVSVDGLLGILEMWYVWRLQTGNKGNISTYRANRQLEEVNTVGNNALICVTEIRDNRTRDLPINRSFHPTTPYSGTEESWV